MIFSKKYSISILTGSLIIVLGLQGCDKVSQLVNYFSPQKGQQKQAVQKEAVSASKKKDVSSTEKAPASQSSKKNVLVRVGNWELTIEEFRERLKSLQEVVPQYDPNNLEQNRAIIEEVVNQQLLAQAAQKQGIADKKEIMTAVEEFKNTLLVREMVTQIVEDIKVTEEEAKTFYDQNQQEFVAQAEWKLREIVVATEEEAKAILVDLFQGADFAETAKAKSTGETKDQGGDLGYVSINGFTFPKMAEVVFTLEKGDISRSFQGPEGFYIVKVEDKRGGDQQEFSEVKEEIINGLTMIKQQQTIMTTLEKLRKEIKVDINLKLLEE